jgi:hypothetical protein
MSLRSASWCVGPHPGGLSSAASALLFAACNTANGHLQECIQDQQGLAGVGHLQCSSGDQQGLAASRGRRIDRSASIGVGPQPVMTSSGVDARGMMASVSGVGGPQFTAK